MSEQTEEPPEGYDWDNVKSVAQFVFIFLFYLVLANMFKK